MENSVLFDDIFLLSKKQWEDAIASVPNVPVEQDGPWWLRSPGYDDYDAANVEGDGSVDHFGHNVTREFGVRPAFLIPQLKTFGFKPGQKVTVGNKTVCTVITENIVLADKIVCTHRFDNNFNGYIASEIEQHIHSDKFKEIL